MSARTIHKFGQWYIAGISCRLLCLAVILLGEELLASGLEARSYAVPFFVDLRDPVCTSLAIRLQVKEYNEPFVQFRANRREPEEVAFVEMLEALHKEDVDRATRFIMPDKEPNESDRQEIAKEMKGLIRPPHGLMRDLSGKDIGSVFVYEQLRIGKDTRVFTFGVTRQPAGPPMFFGLRCLPNGRYQWPLFEIVGPLEGIVIDTLVTGCLYSERINKPFTYQVLIPSTAGTGGEVYLQFNGVRYDLGIVSGTLDGTRPEDEAARFYQEMSLLAAADSLEAVADLYTPRSRQTYLRELAEHNRSPDAAAWRAGVVSGFSDPERRIRFVMNADPLYVVFIKNPLWAGLQQEYIIRDPNTGKLAFTNLNRQDILDSLLHEKKVKAALEAVVLGRADTISTPVGRSAGSEPNVPQLAVRTDRHEQTGSFTGPAEAGRLIFEKTQLDIGMVPVDTVRHVEFRFFNAGKGILRLGVFACCGVSAKPSKQEFGANEDGTLVVELRTPSNPGSFEKGVFVSANDPANPKMELTIVGKAVETIAWSPNLLEFITTDKPSAQHEITIKSLDGTQFAVRGIECSDDLVAAEFDPEVRSTEFTIRPKLNLAKASTLGSGRAALRIHLDHRDYNEIEIPVRLIPPLEAVPSQIFVFDWQPNQIISRVVRLKDHQKGLTEVGGLQVQAVSTSKGSKANLISVRQEDNTLELYLQIDPVEARGDAGMLSDELIVKLTDGRRVHIPVHVFRPGTKFKLER